MLSTILSILAAGAAPQDTGTLDVPVYRNAAYGVAVARPFDDWVFSASRSGPTTTALFHPRRESLRGQLWGALVLASFDGPVPLDAAADQRVTGEWREALGRSFRVLTRDSLEVRGLPAIHVVMAGAVNRVAVDVEEYYVARDRDLLILQFRYPRGLPRDSIAAGYERSFRSLTIEPRGAARLGAPRAAPPPAAPAAEADVSRDLAASPWNPRAVEALVRFDPAAARADMSVRVEIVNEGTRRHASVPVALRAPFVLDSVRGPTGARLEVAPGAVAAVRLARPVEPEATTAVTFAYHVDSSSSVGASLNGDVLVSADRLLCLADWLPSAWASAGAAGGSVPARQVRFVMRFDLPEGFTAVTAGRLAADVRGDGRRRQTWVSDSDGFPTQGFLIGQLRQLAARSGRLAIVRVWTPEREDALTDATERADLLAAEAIRAWEFYSRAFGRLPDGDVELVLAGRAQPRAAGTTLFLPTSASTHSVRVAVAGAWWGGSVRFAGPGAAWLSEALPAWSALALRAALEGDSTRSRLVREAEASREPVAALEAARRAVGDARFRIAIRTLFLEHRRRSATLADLLDLLGTDGASAITQN